MAQISWAKTSQPIDIDFLSSAELVVYRQKLNPKQKHDFLIGRQAARAAIFKHLPQIDIRRIEVLNSTNPEDTGRPQVFFDGQPFGSISISHRNNTACAAFSNNHIVGIDIELVEARDESFAEIAFTPSELVFLSSCQDRPIWETLIWSAKEAMSKMLAKGLSVPTYSLLTQPGSHSLGKELSWRGSYDSQPILLQSYVSDLVMTVAWMA